MKYYPNLALADLFRQALAVVGPNRLGFAQQKIFADNFDRSVADR